MPDHTGEDLSARVLAVRPDFPVLLISGYVDPKLLVKIRALGVRDFVRKPISLHDLACLVSRHVRKPDSA